MAGRTYENLTASDPRNVLTGRFLAESYGGTGIALIDLGQAIEGAKYLRKSVDVLESLPTENPNNLDVLSAFADSYEGLAAADETQGH